MINFIKKTNSAYVSSLNDPNASQDIITKLTNKRNNALKNPKILQNPHFKLTEEPKQHFTILLMQPCKIRI